ncbi:hypothetical protein T11_13019 [Trichinella zimbabwensis]|uniref:PiggyBac transposable element-derived protein domain-containing protein n=1 Tax=Trichinella zimbabwensis TaxID=268475 RepID=A0A0V1HNI9_9BILA|nr:hypothetical protein T11_13019 [Trichinella zimbabwensis]
MCGYFNLFLLVISDFGLTFSDISQQLRNQQQCGYKKSFPRKFRNFGGYRLACFTKNGEKIDDR